PRLSNRKTLMARWRSPFRWASSFSMVPMASSASLTKMTCSNCMAASLRKSNRFHVPLVLSFDIDDVPVFDQKVKKRTGLVRHGHVGGGNDLIVLFIEIGIGIELHIFAEKPADICQ